MKFNQFFQCILTIFQTLHRTCLTEFENLVNAKLASLRILLHTPLYSRLGLQLHKTLQTILHNGLQIHFTDNYNIRNKSGSHSSNNYEKL